MTLKKAKKQDSLFASKKEVTTARGEISVRELVLEDIQILISEFITIFGAVDDKSLKGNDSATIIALFSSPVMIPTFKRILAQVTDKEVTFYDQFSIVDVMKVIKAFLQVNDIMELKNVFFDLKEMLMTN